MNYLNLPPVWLLGFVAAAWGISRVTEPGPPLLVWAGAGLVLAALALMGWAVLAFRRARTTIVPRERPSALVAAGPYRFSRNPIYLADLAILAGAALILRAPVALVLLVPFQQVLLRLFILPEEAVLEQDLGQPYRDFKARVRRWL
ncbi:MAG TPA: isoprenylcysteine carboxylmethyltransferase family protein [Thermohalobaculum sp.]|nr:isoprenylcysteine carboxylmethyltransferase family protein [Thermohalobaculum sp.]